MMANNSSLALNKTVVNNETTYPTRDQLLNMVGFVDFLDYLWIYANIPINIIGAIFNLLALIILQDREFNMRLYDYLRVYCVNSFVTNVFTIFPFTANAPFVLPWTNCGPANVFFIFLIVPINNIGCFFGTAMDILILLDRIGTLKANVTRWLTLSAYKTSFLFLIFCSVVDFPFFFVFQPNSLKASLNATFVQTIWFPVQSVYAESEAGTIITFTIYAIRDFLFTAIEIVLNVVSVFLLKDHIATKSRLLNNTVAPAATIQSKRKHCTENNRSS
jgi:hypothetical protein